MDQIKIHQYIQNQLSRAPSLLKSYTQDEFGNKYLPRGIFVRIKNIADNFIKGEKEIRMIAIPGLRGVGKTTILAQLFLELFPKYQNELFYISTDQITNILGTDLKTILENYQDILGTSFEKLDKNIFIFIDEIHYDKNWPSILKSIYDKSKNVFVLCTGSSALSLQSTTDLARRIVFEKLYPMSFGEYILLKTKLSSFKEKDEEVKFPNKELKEEIKNALSDSPNAGACFSRLKGIQRAKDDYWLGIDTLEINQYLKFGSMPFALAIRDKNQVRELINELIDKVIKKDLFEVEKFTTGVIDKIKNILLMIASGDEISITSMAKNLTDISANTLINIFSALEKAEMIIRVYPYGSVFKKVRKPSKYYFMSSALRYTLLSIVEGENAFERYKGKYLEDMIALSLCREFNQQKMSTVFYDSAKGGADFILQLGQRKIVIEVGFGKKNIKQAQNTLNKIKGDYGIVISEKKNLTCSGNIVQLPLSYFLLI